MTSIIDQADSIVGINPVATGLDEKSRDRLRRGAYVEWLLLNQDADEEMVCGTIEHNATWIVKLHAASQPKGDGLPDGMWVTSWDGGKYGLSVEVCASHMSRAGRCALHEYIALCLTTPVRRLLAAFDVVELDSELTGLDSIPVRAGRGKFVCWLVPKGAK